MRSRSMFGGTLFLSLVALVLALDVPAVVADAQPQAAMITVGAATFFSCVMGLLVAHARSDEINGHGRTTTRTAANDEFERLVAERTRALSEKIAELEKARAAAVEADVAKSRFLATMSHELRTPLNAIIGFSELIKREMFGPAGDARYVEYATNIHDSGFHLLSLIRDILDLSRIEAGRMEIESEKLDVGEVVDEARRLAGNRSGHVSVLVADDLPVLFADRRATLQMLLNLLSNAMKFTPSTGAIAVTATARNDGGITLNVRDNGVGIAREDIPKALAPYSQVTSGTVARQDGTGLGLPIVQALVTLHGGTLQIESETGEGTSVSLHFPPERSVRGGLEAKVA